MSRIRRASAALLAACLLAQALPGSAAVRTAAPRAAVPGASLLGGGLAALGVPALAPAAGLVRPALLPRLAPALAAPASPALAPNARAGLESSAGNLASLLPAPAAAGAEAAAPTAAELGRTFDGARPEAAAFVVWPDASAGHAPAPRPIESIRELRLGSYNVENLFENVGKHVPDPQRPGRLKKISNARPKPDWALREEAGIIREQDLDVVTLAEVENVAALEDFNARFLGAAYRVYLIEGNDERGIDVAFLVKKDLPFVVEQRSHKGETWIDPVLGGGPKPLFSRDLPAMIFHAPGRDEPLFILFGTHYKSKRDRPGDRESAVWRAAQVRRTAEIIARYRAEFGAGVPILLSGDFNGAVDKETAFRPLYEEAGLTDSFDAAPEPVSGMARVTHTYHPRGGATQYKQLDAVLVSDRLRGTVKSARVYRYKNQNGTERPIPKSYQERQRNPSDHFPLIVTLDFAPIRAGLSPRREPAAAGR
ncbi:MAG: hypothetical protein PHF00_05975 [Elusimicrobia bacterium]|nr:hypothetical protein [Elusimicrobiota bacterium]